MKRLIALLGVLGSAGLCVGAQCGVTQNGSCSDDLTCPPSTLTEAGAPEGSIGSSDSGAADHSVSDAPSDGDATTLADTGEDAGVDAPIDTNPPCDPASTPAESACVISDDLAIFVAPTGSDTNVGTMEAPVKTLAHGVTLATTASAHRVIACAATYAEAVTLSATQDVGLQIFGGVTCAGGVWTYTGAKAVAAPSAHGYALSVSGLTHALDIEDFEFDAQSGTAAGESSIGGFVSGMPATLSLHRVTFTAGSAGAAGTPGATPTAALPVPTNGMPGAAPNDGAQVSCLCPNSGVTSVGGAGGTAAGSPGLPPLGEGDAGDPNDPCNKGGNGGNGANASAVSPASGATTYGVLSGAGWAPSGGAAGAAGGPGQGGGGGAGEGGNGGGGACGGCGGSPATPGHGGGSSIALLVFDSVVTFDSCSLTTGAASAGGRGAAGQIGVGGGGSGAGTGAACNGGGGGTGAAGAASGGGAGGVSTGVVWTGTTAPQLDSSTQAHTTLGAPGSGGTGGVPGTNDGKTGTAVGVLSL